MSCETKDEQVLLVVVNLSSNVDPKFQWLYRWLDDNAVRVAKWLLESHYRKIHTLRDDKASSSNFVNKLIELAQEPQTKAIDVFLSLHGLPDTLYFHDGPIATSNLGDQLKAANLKERLRLFYSMACYGASHARDFVRGGFRTASGAVATNTNGPYDYPAQLYNWGQGKTYRAVIKAGNHPAFRTTHDTIAKKFGHDDADSEKVIEGKKLTRITSRAV